MPIKIRFITGLLVLLPLISEAKPRRNMEEDIWGGEEKKPPLVMPPPVASRSSLVPENLKNPIPTPNPGFEGDLNLDGKNDLGGNAPYRVYLKPSKDPFLMCAYSEDANGVKAPLGSGAYALDDLQTHVFRYAPLALHGAVSFAVPGAAQVVTKKLSVQDLITIFSTSWAHWQAAEARKKSKTRSEQPLGLGGAGFEGDGESVPDVGVPQPDMAPPVSNAGNGPVPPPDHIPEETPWPKYSIKPEVVQHDGKDLVPHKQPTKSGQWSQELEDAIADKKRNQKKEPKREADPKEVDVIGDISEDKWKKANWGELTSAERVIARNQIVDFMEVFTRMAIEAGAGIHSGEHPLEIAAITSTQILKALSYFVHTIPTLTGTVGGPVHGFLDAVRAIVLFADALPGKNAIVDMWITAAKVEKAQSKKGLPVNHRLRQSYETRFAKLGAGTQGLCGE